MTASEGYSLIDDLHPIDLVETLAANHDWDFDRVTDDQIAMAVEGQWRTYSITLAWSAYDETLRLICTFEMDPPDERIAALNTAAGSGDPALAAFVQALLNERIRFDAARV